MWSHVRWASGLAAKVREAEDSTGLLLADVFDGLPLPIRDMIRREPRKMYTELAAAVLALDTADLKEAAARDADDRELRHQVREPTFPTKVLRQALENTHLRAPLPYVVAPPPNHQSVLQNPFASRGGGRGNLFGPTRELNFLPSRGAGPGALGMGRGAPLASQSTAFLHSRPPAARHSDLIQYVLPHHPNTPEGNTAYQAQVATWHTANPLQKPDERHQYPLTPGSAPVGSCEC